MLIVTNEYVIDSKENSDYMYNLIDKVIKEAGPRPPCSPEEKKAALLLAEDLKPYCDEVKVEEFGAYPQLGVASWPRRCALLTTLSALIFLLCPFNLLLFSILALGIAVFSVLNVYFQYLKCQEWSPKIYPYKQKTSQNVVGTIKPTGEVKKRVVFVGHIDSAWRFNLLQYTHEGYVYFIIGGLGTLFIFPILFAIQIIFSITGSFPEVISIFNWVAILLPIGLSIVFLVLVPISARVLNEKSREKVLFGAFSKISPFTMLLLVSLLAYSLSYNLILFNYVMTDPSLFKTDLLLILGAIPNLIAFFFFLSKEGVPGALDNLSAVAVSACVAKVLKEWKEVYPDLFPQNTEVVIGLLGCEEIGCRGSISFAKTHAAEYNQIDTTCVVMDTMGDPELLRIFKRESSTRIDFDAKTYNLLADCAKELKLNYKVLDQPWVSGGTDASGLVKGGLRAAAMVGLYYGHYLYYYHSDRDDIAIINKERRPCNEYGTDWHNRNMRCAFENALKVCVTYLQKKDIE